MWYFIKELYNEVAFILWTFFKHEVSSRFILSVLDYIAFIVVITTIIVMLVIMNSHLFHVYSKHLKMFSESRIGLIVSCRQLNLYIHKTCTKFTTHKTKFFTIYRMDGIRRLIKRCHLVQLAKNFNFFSCSQPDFW